MRYLFILALLLTSCTVVPDHVQHQVASYDSTTPPGIDQQNSGLLGWIVNQDGSTWGTIITSDARNRYNLLIEDYGAQYTAENALVLTKDAGVTATVWQDTTNVVYKIDAQHYAAFLLMDHWLADHKDKDSVWMKLKAAP
jgi:hypothetical protein